MLWHYRAGQNAHGLVSGEGLTFTPGSHVYWWFIPPFNLVRPYQATRELYRASYTQEHEPERWRTSDTPRRFGV